MGGPVENLISDYNLILGLGPELGLHLNVAKCELITLDPSVIIKFKAMVCARACHIKVTSPAHAQLLGASLTPQFGLSPSPKSNSPPESNLPPDSLSKKLEYHRHFVKQVNLLHPHDAFYLLKHVYGAAKLTYSLRTIPSYGNPILDEYDALTRSALNVILGTTLSDSDWDKASLPGRLGGMGIRKTTTLALPAYLSSIHATAELTTRLLPELPWDTDPVYQTALAQWRSQLLQLQPSLAPQLTPKTRNNSETGTNLCSRGPHTPKPCYNLRTFSTHAQAT